MKTKLPKNLRPKLIATKNAIQQSSSDLNDHYNTQKNRDTVLVYTTAALSGYGLGSLIGDIFFD